VQPGQSHPGQSAHEFAAGVPEQILGAAYMLICATGAAGNLQQICWLQSLVCLHTCWQELAQVPLQHTSRDVDETFVTAAAFAAAAQSASVLHEAGHAALSTQRPGTVSSVSFAPNGQHTCSRPMSQSEVLRQAFGQLLDGKQIGVL
jgi:hypothetical protein